MSTAPEANSGAVSQGVRTFALVGAVLLLAFVMRVLDTAQEELRLAALSDAQGDRPAAVLHYGRAAACRLPWSPFHRTAIQQLVAIAGGHERAGEDAQALSVYRAARGAMMASRGLWELDAPWRDRVDDRIAALMAARGGQGTGDPASIAKRRARFRAELSAPAGLSPLLALAFLLGAVAFGFGVAPALGDGTAAPAGMLRRPFTVAIAGIGLLTLACALS